MSFDVRNQLSYDFQQVGSEWRQFGNALKFNFTKLDALAAETESQVKKKFKICVWIISNCLSFLNYFHFIIIFQSDAVHKMVLDWMAWKKEKATVGRLSKALYLNKEWEAILSLTP